MNRLLKNIFLYLTELVSFLKEVKFFIKFMNMIKNCIRKKVVFVIICLPGKSFPLKMYITLIHY